MLFNLMMVYGFVPDGFGKGILIPLLKDNNADQSLCENYRCVTLSSIISKVFEYAVLEKYSSFFLVDDLQFGFKKNVGCSDALVPVKSVVNHFVNNGSTVTLTTLDISKAFDRISHFALFNKLMKLKFPKSVINILLSWYTKCFVKVRWNNNLSESFQTLAGVRQGGVLSPLLFAIYIDDILQELKVHKKGCMIGRIYLGCFLYADDILLLSQSVSCMQSMLNICDKVAGILDLKFIVKKCAVLRIGKRYDVKCSILTLADQNIPFVEEVKYLGIYIKSGSVFNRSLCEAKVKFYRCFNALYSKAVSASSELILVNLLKSYCLPIITYACEAVSPNKSDAKTLNKLIFTVFCKIFKSFDVDVIADTRYFFNLHDIAEMIQNRHNKFMKRYNTKKFIFCDVVCSINCVNYY